MSHFPRHLRPVPRPRQLLTAFAAAAALVVTTTGASGNDDVGNGAEFSKVLICHATTSNGNPYIINTPDKSGDVSGHADHDGPVWNEELKKQHIEWGDIIPPFDYYEGDVLKHYPGLNWTDRSEQIFDNDCKVPPPVLTLTVVKTNDANGDGTFSDDETATVVGAPVTFTVSVTNTSIVPVTLDEVTDAVGGSDVPITCSLEGTTLAADATASCTFTVAGYTPADDLSKTNTATVTGHEAADGPDGVENTKNTVTASDTSVVRTDLPPVPPALSLSVVKTNDADGDGTPSDDETATAAGASVTFTVAVTNNSPVAVVVDDVRDAVGGSDIPVTCSLEGSTLAVGATASCTFTLSGYTPADGGSKTNTVTVTGHEDGDAGNTTSDTDTSVVRTDVPPATLSLLVVKTNDADGDGTYHDTETAPAAGQDVPYKVVVTNTSAVPVELDTLTDEVGDAAPVAVSCPSFPSTLGSGASVTCTFVLEDSSPAAGSSLTDTVTATAHEPGDPENDTSGSASSTVTTSEPAPGTPDLAIVKTGPTDALAPGEAATYTLTVRNKGTATAPSVVVDDAVPAGTTLTALTADGFTCTGSEVHCVLDAPLPVGATATISLVLTLDSTYADDSVTNTGTVGPTDATPEDNTSTVTTPVVVLGGGGGGPVTGGGAGTDAPGGGGEALPVTGAPLIGLAQAAHLLLVAGGLLLLLGRRRRSTAA